MKSLIISNSGVRIVQISPILKEMVIIESSSRPGYKDKLRLLKQILMPLEST